MTFNPESFEQQIIGRYAPAPSYDGFQERHGQLVEQTREKMLGTVAALGGLNDADPVILPDRIQELYDSHRADVTNLKALTALDDYLYNRTWQYEGERREPHQALVMQDTLSALSQGEREGHAELATSTGKTYIIAKTAEAMHLAGLRVLVLAPKKVIADQLRGENGEKGLGKFAPQIPPESIGQHYDGVRAKKTDLVVVSTYQSFNKFAVDGSIGEFDVMLADEAHRGLGEVTSKNLTDFSPHAVKIGYTATPEFGTNRNVAQIWPKRIHSLGLREAIEADLVSPAQALVFSTGVEIKITDPESREFTEAELRRLRSLKARNEKAIEFAKSFIEDGRKGIIPCVPGADLAHPKLVAELLEQIEIVDKRTGEKRNIVAKAVGNSIADTAESLAAFHRGEVDVLTFVDLISEGFDSDLPSFCINLCPTTSLLKAKQLFGRIIRKKADDPRPAIFVDFLDEAVGKRQMTALHALEEEKYELGKVYSSGSGSPNSYWNNYLEGILYPDLYTDLRRLDGQLVNDFQASPKADRARLESYYERILAKEDLQSDTNIMGTPKKLLDAVEEFEDRFLQQYERMPDRDEIFSELNDLGLLRKKDGFDQLIGTLLSREVELAPFDKETGPFADAVAVAEDEECIYPGDITTRDVPMLLNGMSSRDRSSVESYFGIGREALTFARIGEEYEVSGENVRNRMARLFAEIRYDVHEKARSTPMANERVIASLPIIRSDGGIDGMNNQLAQQYKKSLKQVEADYHAYGNVLEGLEYRLGVSSNYDDSLVTYFLKPVVEFTGAVDMHSRYEAMAWLSRRLILDSEFMEKIKDLRVRIDKARYPERQDLDIEKAELVRARLDQETLAYQALVAKKYSKNFDI